MDVSWLSDWLPALSTSGMFSVLGFVLGKWYAAKVASSIRHKYDAKLEEIKSKQRQDEEEFRSGLRARDDQIQALRGGALNRLAGRENILDTRRMEALERIWLISVEMVKLKALARLTRVVKIDYMIEEAANNPRFLRKAEEMTDVLFRMAGFDGAMDYKPDNLSAEKERPFLPETVWALFSAYRSAVTFPVAQLHAARSGLGAKVLDAKPLTDLLTAVLPHQSQFVSQHGASAAGFLVDEIEEALLREIVRALEGASADAAGLARAAAILRAVDGVMTSVQRSSANSVDGIVAADKT